MTQKGEEHSQDHAGMRLHCRDVAQPCASVGEATDKETVARAELGSDLSSAFEQAV